MEHMRACTRTHSMMLLCKSASFL